jgi:hypothetical protein
MLRNPFWTSATGIFFWAVFIPNAAVLLAAFLISHSWFWILLFTISFSILVMAKNQKEQFLKSFYQKKRVQWRKRPLSQHSEKAADQTADYL